MNAVSEVVRIPAGPVMLEADLSVPQDAHGLVIFAHGSGSSRFSRRNRAVAALLQEGALGTLLLDLLTREEEALDEDTREYRFDIDKLARRVVAAADWVQEQPELQRLRIALFGASTGAAAALIAAEQRPKIIGAVVSRGGRPDLAGAALERVQAPTLFIVGGNDEPVIELNEQAMRRMRAPVGLEIVPGATHLFEEPGALDKVAALERDWCRRHLGG
jgi:putative phosphoribosyl transferase